MGLLLGRGLTASARRGAGATFSEPPIPPYLGANPYGQVSAMPTGGEMANPTVWACVRLLADVVSSLTLETFRHSPDGASAQGLEQVPSRVGDPALIRSPSAHQTPSAWVHTAMVSLLLRGNAIGHILAWDSLGRANQIEWLNPDAVTIEVDRSTGELVYLSGAERTRIPTYEVFHVRGLTLPGRRVGLSPIAYAASVIGVDTLARKFGTDFFASGGQPTVILTSDQKIDQTQAMTIKQRFLEAARDRAPVSLGAGVKFDQIKVAPEESQFLATQRATVSQIARYFGVPASMVGGDEGHSMTYQNVEQRSLDFLTYSVAPWLKRLEDALSALLPNKVYVRFRVEDLLRTDAHSRAQVEVLQIAGKFRTPTEVRAGHGWAPFTKAQKDEIDLVPLTITPSGRAAPAQPGSPADETAPNTPAPQGPADDSSDSTVPSSAGGS